MQPGCTRSAAAEHDSFLLATACRPLGEPTVARATLRSGHFSRRSQRSRSEDSLPLRGKVSSTDRSESALEDRVNKLLSGCPVLQVMDDAGWDEEIVEGEPRYADGVRRFSISARRGLFVFRFCQNASQRTGSLRMFRRSRGPRRGDMSRLGWHSMAPASNRCGAVIAGFVLLLAGCSSSDGSTVESIETAASIPATTAVPASTAASTSTTSTIESTTTVAPTTTVDPVVAAETAVREAVALAQSTFSECMVALPACDPSTLAVARSGDLLDRNVKLVDEWNSLGYAVRDRDQFRFVTESVTIGTDGVSATATVCIADASRLVIPNAAPDGSDVVLDDEYTSGRSEWNMRVDPDGAWRVYDTSPIGVAATEDVCGAS